MQYILIETNLHFHEHITIVHIQKQHVNAYNMYMHTTGTTDEDTKQALAVCIPNTAGSTHIHAWTEHTDFSEYAYSTHVHSTMHRCTVDTYCAIRRQLSLLGGRGGHCGEVLRRLTG